MNRLLNICLFLSKGKPNTFNPIKIPCKTAGTVYNIKRPKAISEASKRDRDEIMTTNNTKYKDNIFEYCRQKTRNANTPCTISRRGWQTTINNMEQ